MNNRILYVALALVMAFISACSHSDKDFSTSASDFDCIHLGGCSQFAQVYKDDSVNWRVADGHYDFSADSVKVSALLNVMRDIQVMGIANYDFDNNPHDDIIIRRGDNLVKHIRYIAVPNSPQLIASVDGGRSYVVAVPGLSINPSVSFSCYVNYWRKALLLEIVPSSVASIQVSNFMDPAQSFCVSANDSGYQATDANGNAVAVDDKAIREFLGSVAGAYSAAEYIDTLNLKADDLIYKLCVTNRNGSADSLAFYRKYLPGGRPDFNLMYFSACSSMGTAKYFDFDKLLIDKDRL